jgi:hypothetical protein
MALKKEDVESFDRFEIGLTQEQVDRANEAARQQAVELRAQLEAERAAQNNNNQVNNDSANNDR